jgi:hypothetical protein
MTISTYAGNKVLDLWLRGVAITVPTTIFLSLHTASPGNTGANEVTLGAWPAYVRKDLANGGAIATAFGAAAAKTTDNLIQMLFPAFNGAGTITITHVGIWDALTVGNFIFGDILTASKTLNPTDEVVFKVGDVDVTAT